MADLGSALHRSDVDLVLLNDASPLLAHHSEIIAGGKQYVAVQSGWGIDARTMQARLNRIKPGSFPDVPEGGAVWVFAVK